MSVSSATRHICGFGQSWVSGLVVYRLACLAPQLMLRDLAVCVCIPVVGSETSLCFSPYLVAKLLQAEACWSDKLSVLGQIEIGYGARRWLRAAPLRTETTRQMVESCEDNVEIYCEAVCINSPPAPHNSLGPGANPKFFTACCILIANQLPSPASTGVQWLVLGPPQRAIYAVGIAWHGRAKALRCVCAGYLGACSAKTRGGGSRGPSDGGSGKPVGVVPGKSLDATLQIPRPHNVGQNNNAAQIL
jgi:hypothetical protein